jgi:hypothetical protein
LTAQSRRHMECALFWYLRIFVFIHCTLVFHPGSTSIFAQEEESRSWKISPFENTGNTEMWLFCVAKGILRTSH